MKKTLCILITALMLIYCSALPASAKAEYKNLLLLGDSITYGYGLEGVRDTYPSYGNLLRDYLGLGTEAFKNAAVNGDTSADLLALLPSLADRVKMADLIIITIGGNDLLRVLWNAVAAVTGATASPSDFQKYLSDEAFLNKLSEYLSMAVVSDAVINYSVNLQAIISYLRSNNSSAKIIFLAQYDPMGGVPGLEIISAISSTAIKLLNGAMKSDAALGGCDYLDIYTPFEGKGIEWTNILQPDIHPNKNGHNMIYQYIVKYLETGLQPMQDAADTLAPEATKAPETTKTPETTKIPETTAEPSSIITGEITESPFETVMATAEPEQTTGKENKKSRGCGSVTGMAAIILATFSGGIIGYKKRKEN